MTFFLLLILAHFIADFTLQKEQLIADRNSSVPSTRHKALLQHCFIHFTTSVVLVFIGIILTDSINLSNIIMALLIIIMVTVTHYLIDWLKYHLEQRLQTQKSKVILFLSDQMLHLIIIFIPFINMGTNFETVNILENVLLLIILVYVNTIVGSHFLNISLKNITPPNAVEQIKEEEVDLKETNKDRTKQTIITKSKTSYPDDNKKIGRYIGMLERLLIMMFVYSSAFMGITIILAIKSITRFKQFDDKRFAEYYLIGTLMSIIIGISIGYLARLLVF